MLKNREMYGIGNGFVANGFACFCKKSTELLTVEPICNLGGGL